MSDRLLKEHEVTFPMLMANGWEKDDELKWWKDGIEYDFISSILWVRKDYGIHGVDSIKRLNECMASIHDINALKQYDKNYMTEF